MLCVAIQPPKKVAAPAGDLHGIGPAMSEANSAAVSTTEVIPAVPDEVSALRRAQSGDTTMYRAVNARPTSVHDLFGTPIENSAGSCAAMKAANLIVIS